eukprot:SAG11_NODE_3101_length_2690_cov_4.351216_2_plen_266_part_00
MLPPLPPRPPTYYCGCRSTRSICTCRRTAHAQTQRHAQHTRTQHTPRARKRTCRSSAALLATRAAAISAIGVVRLRTATLRLRRRAEQGGGARSRARGFRGASTRAGAVISSYVSRRRCNLGFTFTDMSVLLYAAGRRMKPRSHRRHNCIHTAVYALAAGCVATAVERGCYALLSRPRGRAVLRLLSRPLRCTIRHPATALTLAAVDATVAAAAAPRRRLLCLLRRRDFDCVMAARACPAMLPRSVGCEGQTVSISVVLLLQCLR